jgi:hypothetical protein
MVSARTNKQFDLIHAKLILSPQVTQPAWRGELIVELSWLSFVSIAKC